MLTIIGCGNPNRQDDGVGSVVIGRLKELAEHRHWPEVRLLDAGLDGSEVMFYARGADALIVIDANRPGSEPGSISEVPSDKLGRDKFGRDELARAREPGLTPRDFRWEQALDAGRKIHGGDFPKDITVYLVEAERLGSGLELSPPVAAAVEPVVERIAARIAIFFSDARVREEIGPK